MTSAKPVPPAPEPSPDAVPLASGEGAPDTAETAEQLEAVLTPGDVANANVAAALKAMDEANPGPVTADPDEAPDPDPPVYDERGNVRPRGTPGAEPMTKAKRIRIAQRLAAGEQIVTTSEKKPRKG